MSDDDAHGIGGGNCRANRGTVRGGHFQAVLAQQLDDGYLADHAPMFEDLTHHGSADFITALRVEVDFVDRAAGCIYGELQAAIIGRRAEFSYLWSKH